MELGEKITLARKKKAMSQEDLANLLNVSRQAVQKWESGASIPEVNKLVQISNMLDVSLDYLLKDTKEDNKKEETNSNKEEKINIKFNDLSPKQKKYRIISIVLLFLGMVLFLGGVALILYGFMDFFANQYFFIILGIVITILGIVSFVEYSDFYRKSK